MNKNRRLAWTASICAVICGAALSAHADPARDGSGTLRASLNEMELKPFAGDLWGKLSDWQNGELAAGLTTGKVVLIVAYNDFTPAAKRAFGLAQKLATAHGKDGLIVVAAHAIRGWSDATKPKVEDGSLRIAHDAKGEFRKALRAESDPDFYLIDRAGQMRFAGVQTDSVEEGVKQLLAEDAEKAGGTKARNEAVLAAKDAEERRTRAAREKVDLTKFPELPYVRPAEELYTAAKWPKLPRDQTKNDEIAYMEPRDVPIPDTGWFPSKPNMSGKLIILYFWHPDALTFSDGAEYFDAIARRYQRDVIVVGVLTDVDGFRVGNQTIKLRKDQKDVEKLSERMVQFVKNRKFDHYLLVDTGKSVYESVFKDQQDSVYPFAVIATDGKARWWGDRPAVTWESALETMFLNDPGVLSRRAAETEWLRKQKGASAIPASGN